MSYEPAYSPWGLIQTRKTLCPGFFDVSTASHGGIMVAREFVAGNLSPTAQRYGFWEGGYLCFEEDSDAQIVLRELMDRGLYTAPVNEYFGPGEYSKCIRFLYKGIIIKHNKTEPTYTKTSLFLCEKRCFLWPGLRKEGNLFKLAGPGGLAFFHLTKKEVSKWPMKK